MERVILGMTGLRVSPIVFGAWQLGGDWGTVDEGRAISTIQRSRELGVNFFDTAQGYGWGASERLLGRALRDDLDGRRDDLVIATKGGIDFSAGGLRRDSSPDWLRRGVEESLTALGVDYIDVYQVHWPDPQVPFADSAAALQTLVDEGLIRHVGVSNFDAQQMREFAETRPVETLQPPYNLFRRDIEQSILPYCEDRNIGVLVYGPLAHGLLSGALRADTQFAPGDWRGQYREFSGDAYRRNLDVVDRLKRYARETFGCSVSQLALAWVLAQSAVHCAIVGTTNPRHLEEAVHAAELVLTPEQAHEIEAIVSEGVALAGVTPETF